MIAEVLLLLSALAAPQPLNRERYLRLAESYLESSLDAQTAARELARKHELDRVLDALRVVPPDRRKVKAAVLMHTEIGFLHAGIGDESARDLQIDVAERLLPLARDERFEAQWRLAAGHLYQSALSPSAAVEHFEKAWRILPGESEIGIAMVYEALGALELAQIPSWSVPDLERTHRERRTTEQHRRDGRKRLFRAIESYSDAIGRNARSATAYLRRGRCYQLLGEQDDALSDYRRALELAPTERERGIVHLFLGKLYGDRGSFEESRSHYREALARLPDWQEPGLGLSHALQELGRTSESRAVLDRAIEVPASSPDSLAGIQQYVLDTGGFRDIVEALRREVTP